MTKTDLSLSAQIESLLLFKGGAVKVSELAEVLEQRPEVVREALEALQEELSSRGVALVYEGGRVALTTAGGTLPLIEKMRRDELEGTVGKAGLETLAVIIFKGPVSRSDIEYIRGVNVSTMLRSLMMRGLIERVENPEDKRSFLYQSTPDLAAYLGVTKLSDLPRYAEIRAELEQVSAGIRTPEEQNV